MSKARDEYYKEVDSMMDLTRWKVIDYVSELEQQKAELIEFACNNCIGICYYDECKIYKLKNT